MSASEGWGLFLVVAAGLLVGSGAWPIKLMKGYRYEHFALVACLLGFLVLPWAITVLSCPRAWEACTRVDWRLLAKANLFSLAWGVANVLSTLAMLRIGVALQIGLLTGIGIPIGVLMPVLFKGTGAFAKAPDIASRSGVILLAGCAVMVAGVVLLTLAGFGRERALRLERPGDAFLPGFVMAVVAGLLQAGMSLSFVYCQGPVTEALKARGGGEFGASFGVWAVCLLAGGLVNVVFPAWVLLRNRSWGTFGTHPGEMALSLYMGVAVIVFFAMVGKGMQLLGPLGASVGFGVYQAFMIIGGQALGFASGEWRGVTGRPRRMMAVAIALLLVAVPVMAWGNATA
jgi:L-rhamnose-H+ transport protein